MYFGDTADADMLFSVSAVDDDGGRRRRTRDFIVHSSTMEKMEYFKGLIANYGAFAHQTSDVYNFIIREEVNYMDDIDAIGMVLSAAYGTEPDAITTDDQLHARLRAWVQADCYQASEPMLQMLATGLDGLPRTAIGAATAMWVMSSEHMVTKLPSTFVDNCGSFVYEQFRTAKAAHTVGQGGMNHAPWTQLTHAAVLHFLKDADAAPSTRAKHSEDDITFMLIAWADSNSSCSAPQLHRLADTLFEWNHVDREHAHGVVLLDWMDSFVGSRLLQLFGNVSEVVAAPDLRRRFRALSPFFIKGWVTRSELRVRSENEVIFLASDWLSVQRLPVGVTEPRAPYDDIPAELTDMANFLQANVRLIDCGLSFLQSALEWISWLPKFERDRHPKYIRSHANLYALYAATAQNMPDMPGLTVQNLPGGIPDGMPEGWFEPPRARLLDPRVSVECAVSVSDESDVETESVFINGFMVSVRVKPRVVNGMWGLRLVLIAVNGLFVSSDRDRFTVGVRVESLCVGDGITAIYRADNRIFVITGESAAWDWDGICNASTIILRPDLVDGKLKFRLTFSGVDMWR